MSRRRRGHTARDAVLVAVLGAFMVIAAIIQIAGHLALLAVIAAMAAGAYYLGRHARRQARPGQVQQQVWPTGPAAARAVPTAALPQADYDWDEPVARQPASLQAGPDNRDKLLADPRSGVRPLSPPRRLS